MYDFSVLRELRKRTNQTIQEVSEQSGVSPAVISKLERNQTQAELETLYRLARVFGITASELVALAESQTAQTKSAEVYRSGGFSFTRVSYSNLRSMYGSGLAGSEVSRPEIHRDDYEICWVLEGSVRISLPNERYDLRKGESVQFDAVLEHTYEVLEDCQLFIVHLAKAKRF